VSSSPILFYDSGAGGLPYLAAVRARLPAEPLVYLADRANYPFGEKEAGRLTELVLATLELAVRRFAPRLAVIACNTASVAALAELRRRFPFPFVGVVPAVKPAVLLGPGRIAVVATRQTAAGPYLARLIEDFAAGVDVLKVPVSGLVDLAEYGYFTYSRAEKRRRVREQLQPLQEQQVAAVVLGCTHFLLLADEFRAALPPATVLIDSLAGVTNRVVDVLRGGALRSGPAPGPGGAELYLHGGEQDQERYRQFARAFGLDFRGRIEAPAAGG